MTVFENTAYRLYEHEWPEDKVQTAVHEILRFVGLESDIDLLPEELSIGMRRRLEIARALVGWPRIMLFDEPATGLDPINNKMILDLIARARDLHGISMLVVTKEMHEIRYLATHHAERNQAGEVRVVEGAPREAPQVEIMVVDEGRIVFTGRLEEFEASELPSVRVMTRPPAAAPTGQADSRDPWADRWKHEDESQ